MIKNLLSVKIIIDSLLPLPLPYLAAAISPLFFFFVTNPIIITNQSSSLLVVNATNNNGTFHVQLMIIIGRSIVIFLGNSVTFV